MNFKESQTMKNLTRAFAAECQDGAKYQYMADEATQEQLSFVSTILKGLATNEMAHAKVFFDYINEKEPGGIEMVDIEASYPMQKAELVEMLNIKGENELRQSDSIYPEFAKTAKKEGFSDIAKKLDQIATIEKCHADVLFNLHKKLKNNSLYASKESVLWKCTNCGHEEDSKKAWKTCPICNMNQGYVKITLCDSAKKCECLP